MSSVRIVEVGARDGLQNEKKALRVSTRVEFVKKLSDAGLRRIEVGSFVSSKWVPQMVHTGKVFEQVKSLKAKSVRYSALVPNQRGMLQAISAKMKDVAIFGSCSEAFSHRNINRSIKDSFREFQSVIRLAKANKIRVRGYLSMAFGCPYEGKVSLSKVTSLTQRMLQMGVYEVSIGDTLGIATPKQTEQLLKLFIKRGLSLKSIALHMHDTRGMALANALMGMQYGVRTFDSSLGGVGGCPYAKGASGNLATEDLVYMLHGMGFKTGVDLEKLVQIKPWVEKKIGRLLPSKVTTATCFIPSLGGRTP